MPAKSSCSHTQTCMQSAHGDQCSVTCRLLQLLENLQGVLAHKQDQARPSSPIHYALHKRMQMVCGSMNGHHLAISSLAEYKQFKTTHCRQPVMHKLLTWYTNEQMRHSRRTCWKDRPMVMPQWKYSLLMKQQNVTFGPASAAKLEDFKMLAAECQQSLNWRHARRCRRPLRPH